MIDYGALAAVRREAARRAYRVSLGKAPQPAVPYRHQAWSCAQVPCDPELVYFFDEGCPVPAHGRSFLVYDRGAA